MNDGILLIGTSLHLHGRHTHLHTILALAAAHGLHVCTYSDWNVPSNEEVTKDLLLKFETPKLTLPEPFFPKESAWERRNSNAPWYRRFQTKRRHR